MPQSWRLIPLMQADGAQQMAIDRWLLDQHCRGEQPSILRFYTWAPVALSLGYHQRDYPEYWHHLSYNSQPIDIVKRPTGGRAVLHQGDLTYAVITSGLSPRRRESYEQICQFLIQGWRSLGLELSYGNAGRGYIQNPNCFGTATAADLVTENGAKLIGSAQLHQDGAVLQHGSMRLQGDRELFEQVFGEPTILPQFPAALRAELGGELGRELGNGLDHEKIIAALIDSAQQCFGAELTIAPLTEVEQAAIERSATEQTVISQRSHSPHSH
jgi:lipoate---protein ligase